MLKFQFSGKYALLALALFLVEVIIATYLKHFTFIRNYFGDFLVVILLYCIAKTVYPFKTKSLVIGVFIFACCIEVLQYFNIADLLNLQKNGVARIVTGTQFAFEDILMYAGGCALVWFLESRFCQKQL
ncbi:MAG: DUF2809 domain-containing protein [Methylophilaceae bacterium]